MDKRDQIQQEIDDISISTYGRVSDKRLSNINEALKNAKTYYVYNSNGEFVCDVVGSNAFQKKFKIKPYQRRLKWMVKEEYLGEKIEVNLVKKKPYMKNKKVLQYTFKGEFVKEWDSINDASEYLKLNPSGLSNALCGTQKTAGGFIWKYKD